jgi:FkbM family methyltransferase
MYTQLSKINRLLRRLAWKIFNSIENNGNAHFDQNGEKLFIDNLLNSLSSQKQLVIFDIGANIGTYTQLILEKSNALPLKIELHLFEPTQSCFEVLLHKFKENSNIHLNYFGISNESKQAIIYYDKDQSGLASLYQRNLDAYSLRLDKSEVVELKRVDLYINEKNIEHIDIVKIDIEGHELKAFEGFGDYLNSDFVDYIQFEYGGANLDSHTSLMEIYKFFNDRDFGIAKIMPNGLEVRTYTPSMDNFMYANYVAISNRILKK